jgi:hypothetical protein
MKIYLLGASALALTLSTPAAAVIAVDGVRDAGYGAASATVATDANAPHSNFQAPTNIALAGYDIYLSSDASNVYGYFDLTGGAFVGNFSNVYWDLDPSAANGSDLGFEIGINGVTAFIPGKNGQPGFNKVLDSSLYQVAAVADGGIEWSLAASLFRGPIAGLAYYSPQGFENKVNLRLSQALSFSVAGGASYGPNRLGQVSIAAVPEPATWAMMIGGFGLAGVAMRRRARTTVALG